MKYLLGSEWVRIPTIEGYSPSAKVERVADGAIITIKDKDGTTTAKVNDGSGGGGGAAIVEVSELPAVGSANTIYVIKIDDDAVASFIYLDKWYDLGAPAVYASDADVEHIFD